MRVDGPVRIVELERRAAARQHDVRVVERVDRADVGPVAAEQVRVHAILAERRRNDLAAEVLGLVAREHVEQHVAREHVDAHRRDERLVRRVAGKRWRPAGCSGRSPRAARASAFPRTRRSGRCDRTGRCPSPTRRRCVTGCAAIVMSARAIDVRVDQLAVVHAVEMIAGENQVVVGVVAGEVPRRLPHRVGGALKPVRVVRRLLGRQDFDEPVAEEIHPVGLRRCGG